MTKQKLGLQSLGDVHVTSPFAELNQKTKDFIFSAVPENTRRAYKQAVAAFTKWLDGRPPSDAILADYIRILYEEGKSPSTIRLVVAAVNWVAKHAGLSPIGKTATSKAFKAARLKDAERKAAGEVTRRGQVAGLTWDKVAKVCGAIESDNTIRGLRDSADINDIKLGGQVQVFGKGEGKVVMGIDEYGNGGVNTWDKNGYRQ